MTALRMTRPEPDGRPTPTGGRGTGFARVLALGLCAAVAGIIGCGSDPNTAAVDRENTTTPLPPPATDRIDYDAGTRTLTFYDLPNSGRWMVQMGDAIYLVGPDHRLPAGVDPQRTYVCYTRPGGQTSLPVSLSQIQAAREMHKSPR